MHLSAARWAILPRSQLYSLRRMWEVGFRAGAVPPRLVTKPTPCPAAPLCFELRFKRAAYSGWNGCANLIPPVCRKRHPRDPCALARFVSASFPIMTCSLFFFWGLEQLGG